jgi:hypothetical protein
MVKENSDFNWYATLIIVRENEYKKVWVKIFSLTKIRCVWKRYAEKWM